MRLKDKFSKDVGRSAVLYGLKSWAVDKEIEQGMSVVEMRMLKWMNGVTSIVNKMRENILGRFRPVMWKEKSKAIKTVMEMNVKRRGRRSKKMKLDVFESDLKIVGVYVDYIMINCVKRRFKT